jgi:hypothetical protein
LVVLYLKVFKFHLFFPGLYKKLKKTIIVLPSVSFTKLLEEVLLSLVSQKGVAKNMADFHVC